MFELGSAVGRFAALVLGGGLLDGARGGVRELRRWRDRCCERAGVMLPHRFYVARRDAEWDEVYTLAQAGGGRWVCYTTRGAHPFEPCFADVVFRVGNHRLVGGLDARRAVGAGVPAVAAASINWICDREGQRRWTPPAAGALADMTA